MELETDTEHQQATNRIFSGRCAGARAPAQNFQKGLDFSEAAWYLGEDMATNRPNPALRNAFQFITQKGEVTPAELVAWDDAHGRNIFNWNTIEAAEQWRLHQARCALQEQGEGLREVVRRKKEIRVQ